MHANDGVRDTTKNVSISVTNVDDTAPTITSAASASEAENTVASSVVYTVTATDPDTAAGSLSYSLTGTDAAKFSIEAATGKVRFLVSPDFEAPADANGDNTYNITVHANDGVRDATKAVSISVTNVDDTAPTITSAASASEAENTAASSVVYTVTATDSDTAGPLSYSLSGVDAALFSIGAGTGQVRFLASPNFEAPADANADNTLQHHRACQ